MDRTIEILQHTISYYYERDVEMPEIEQEHVADMIEAGHNQGELNYVDQNEEENSGWWSINDE